MNLMQMIEEANGKFWNWIRSKRFDTSLDMEFKMLKHFASRELLVALELGEVRIECGSDYYPPKFVLVDRGIKSEAA